MPYSKGDIIHGYEIVQLLKDSDTAETYLVRNAIDRLRVMKIKCTDNEYAAAHHTPLFVTKGEFSGGHYVVYRYVKSETLEQRLSRKQGVLGGSLSKEKRLLEAMARHVVNLHKQGFYHNNLTADNVILDLFEREPLVWLTGFSNITNLGTAKEDITALMQLINYVIFRDEPPKPPLKKNKELPKIDEQTQKKQEAEAKLLYDDIMQNPSKYEIKIYDLGEEMAIGEQVIAQYWKPRYLIDHRNHMAIKFFDGDIKLTTVSHDDIMWETLTGCGEKAMDRARRLSFFYPSHIYHYNKGVAQVEWQLCPDGMYYADSDGYGMTDDVEYNIYGFIDRQGRVVAKFRHIKKNDLRAELKKMQRVAQERVI